MTLKRGEYTTWMNEALRVHSLSASFHLNSQLDVFFFCIIKFPAWSYEHMPVLMICLQYEKKKPDRIRRFLFLLE